MNEKLKFEKNLNELNKHIKKLHQKFNYLKSFYELPLNENYIETIINDENDDSLDVIAYRFTKLQDTLGRTIRLWLFLKGENIENLSMIDILNLAQKLGLELDSEKWFKLRSLRNSISHEYEDNYSKIANTLNEIEEYLNQLNKIIKALNEA